MTAIIVDDEGRAYSRPWGLGFEFVYPTTNVIGERHTTEFSLARFDLDRRHWTTGPPFVFATRRSAERRAARMRARGLRVAVVGGDGLDAPHAGKAYLRRVVERMRAENAERARLRAAVLADGTRLEVALGALR